MIALPPCEAPRDQRTFRALTVCVAAGGGGSPSRGPRFLTSGLDPVWHRSRRGIGSRLDLLAGTQAHQDEDRQGEQRHEDRPKSGE
jgi:hypothetical protein